MFSEKALSAQEPLIISYVDKLISELHRRAGNPNTATVDLVRWYNFTTFDVCFTLYWNLFSHQFPYTICKKYQLTISKVLGDLAFGDSFGCLESDILHVRFGIPIMIIFWWEKSWIVNLFCSIKEAGLYRGLRHLSSPFFELLWALRPKALKENRAEEFEFATQRARARMSQGVTDRVDFMSYILKYNDEKGWVSSLVIITTNAYCVGWPRKRSKATHLYLSLLVVKQVNIP